ncbi:hypothetical protein CW304_05165 [Bacillus sp. UFRGS-B20]|nr:hypothetical protein CW304_05165 [Bacillus sp. UFRGS-B20]
MSLRPTFNSYVNTILPGCKTRAGFFLSPVLSLLLIQNSIRLATPSVLHIYRLIRLSPSLDSL